MEVKYADDGSFSFRIKKKEILAHRNPAAWVEDIIFLEGHDPDECEINSRWSYTKTEMIFMVRPNELSSGK